jgi:hypothetical protein
VHRHEDTQDRCLAQDLTFLLLSNVVLLAVLVAMGDADSDVKSLEDAAKKPLDEQVADKSWKIRKQAYESMLVQLRRDSSVHQQYAHLSPKAVSDSNQGAQDVACDLVLALLEQCDSVILEHVAASVAESLVGNALNSRPAIVNKATEVLLRLVEHGFASDVIAATSKGYSHKVPKIALASAGVTLDALRQFGPQVISPKLIVPPFLAVFDAKDAKIRATGKDVVIELSRWLGVDKVRATILPKMRDAQQAELETFWAKNPAPNEPVPTRYTRADQARQAPIHQDAEEVTTSAQADLVSAPAPTTASATVPFEAEDLLDQNPISILAKLPRDFFTTLEDAKWSIRKAALASLAAIASGVRAEGGDLHEVVAALKKVLQKDNNAACVAEAATCVAALACSVRKAFANYSRSPFLPLCFDKLKDKNAAVQRQALAALTAMHKHCVQLKDISNSVSTALAASNPQVRQHTLSWLLAAVQHEPAADLKRSFEGILPTTIQLASDAVPAVRDMALAVLVACATPAGGLLAVSKYTSKLDERRMKQLEACSCHVYCLPSDFGCATSISSQNASGRPHDDFIVKFETIVLCKLRHHRC